MNHDDKGRMQSLTYNPGESSGYLTGMSYNLAGQVTGLTLGNGVAESFGYDANRLQLTSQTATKGAASLMNLTYGYQAPAGQMGAGSTAGNAGQLMTISGTINSTTESAAYWYDNLGRLVASNQTTNGSSAQRKFGYDRWGSRTTVWPSVFGGSPIQTVTLEQSGGAPTNRITSVTNNGTPLNYLYDASGNVTNDGVHTYQYDAENRLVSVDGGATAQHKYDHQNRRVSKIIGSSWTHYVWQGSQVIGEHDATTAYTSNPTYQVNSARLDYVYSGSQRIYSRQRASSSGSWTSQYYLSDRLSTRLVLDVSGNVLGRQGHLPFGEDFGESGTQEKHHFTSYERDGESGTDYAVNRQYVQTIGRFNRVDTYRVSGDLSNPQTLDRYSYVGNDPVNLNDPSGLIPILQCSLIAVTNFWWFDYRTERWTTGSIETYGCVWTENEPRMGQRVPQNRCDRARASAAKWYKLANDTRTDYENWIKHIGQQSGQSAAVDSWLNELSSVTTAVDNAIEVADQLGGILRTAASAYANGKRDIYKLQGKLTEFERAFTYSLNLATKIKEECGDAADYDLLFPAKKWNEAFQDESNKIAEDILKDWTPPH